MTDANGNDIVFNAVPFTERFGQWLQTEKVSAWGTALHDPSVYLPLAVTVGCIAAIVGLFVWERKDKGIKMGKLQISNKRKIRIEDRITDIIEDLRYKDLISKDEKLMLYRFFADATNCRGLVKQHPKEVKNKVQRRLGNGVYRTKPAIPGDPPFTMEEISEKKVKPVVKPRAKHSGILALKAS